jgi:hypothetical protein
MQEAAVVERRRSEVAPARKTPLDNTLGQHRWKASLEKIELGVRRRD